MTESVVHTLFPKFYGMYVECNFFDITELPSSTRSLFHETKITSNFRVELEFETGNVASSFRAINKLGMQFQQSFSDTGTYNAYRAENNEESSSANK